jgi:AhpD family alkylhydroperoxidase
VTRIAPSTAFAAVNTQDLGQGDRINLGVAAIMGRLPAAAEALGSLTAALRANGTLPPRLLELVRLRIAFFNQCRSCIAVRYQSAIDDGLDEDAVCSLERPADAENLSAAERSALRFAELVHRAHQAESPFLAGQGRSVTVTISERRAQTVNRVRRFAQT